MLSNLVSLGSKEDLLAKQRIEFKLRTALVAFQVADNNRLILKKDDFLKTLAENKKALLQQITI